MVPWCSMIRSKEDISKCSFVTCFMGHQHSIVVCFMSLGDRVSYIFFQCSFADGIWTQFCGSVISLAPDSILVVADILDDPLVVGTDVLKA